MGWFNSHAICPSQVVHSAGYMLHIWAWWRCPLYCKLILHVSHDIDKAGTKLEINAHNGIILRICGLSAILTYALKAIYSQVYYIANVGIWRHAWRHSLIVNNLFPRWSLYLGLCHSLSQLHVMNLHVTSYACPKHVFLLVILKYSNPLCSTILVFSCQR